MADYILIRKSRNILSSILHVVLNILLGVGSIIITVISGSWLLGVILVAISKWRIFAVRPYYWLTNLKSNLVDVIVGVSFVLIAYCSGTTVLPIHFILAILYTLWLIVLKPRSSDTATEIQSLAAVFLGTTATVLISASLDSLVIVIASFIIGYGASRHVLVQSDDNDSALVTRICGLISAEIAWLCHSWLIVYSFGNTGIVVPQLAIVLTVFSFVFGRVYKSIIARDGKFKFEDVAVPIAFSLFVIIILAVWFSKPIFDI